jgi:hypothetical protein
MFFEKVKTRYIISSDYIFFNIFNAFFKDLQILIFICQLFWFQFGNFILNNTICWSFSLIGVQSLVDWTTICWYFFTNIPIMLFFDNLYYSIDVDKLISKLFFQFLLYVVKINTLIL